MLLLPIAEIIPQLIFEAELGWGGCSQNLISCEAMQDKFPHAFLHSGTRHKSNLLVVVEIAVFRDWEASKSMPEGNVQQLLF